MHSLLLNIKASAHAFLSFYYAAIFFFKSLSLSLSMHQLLLMNAMLDFVCFGIAELEEWGSSKNQNECLKRDLNLQQSAPFGS